LTFFIKERNITNNTKVSCLSSNILINKSEVIDCVVTGLFLLPEGQILLEELNDTLGITEVVLLELVDFVEGLLESLVGEIAGDLVILHDLIVEDREVKGKAELDGVARGERNLVGFLVGLESVLLDGLEEGICRVLSDVAVVVTDHLDEEGLGLTLAGLFKHLFRDAIDDALAVCGELGLDGFLVEGKSILVLLVLGVLLDSVDGAASGALGGDEVLEGNREEVTLI
jgi:hypothetical protein